MREVFRNPALARSLELISRGGREAFYRGEIAQVIAEFMSRNGGFLAEKDFAILFEVLARMSGVGRASRPAAGPPADSDQENIWR